MFTRRHGAYIGHPLDIYALHCCSGLVRHREQRRATDVRTGHPKGQHRPVVFERVLKGQNRDRRLHGHLHDWSKRYTQRLKNMFEFSPDVRFVAPACTRALRTRDRLELEFWGGGGWVVL